MQRKPSLNAVLLAALLTLTLPACGGGDEPDAEPEAACGAQHSVPTDRQAIPQRPCRSLSL